MRSAAPVICVCVPIAPLPKQLPPTRERLPVRTLRRQNQLLHPRLSPPQLVQQTQHRVVVVVIPRRRNLLRQLRQHFLGNALFHSLQPGPERIHSRHALIHPAARVQSAQRRIWKIPFPRVETESLVDHYRPIGPPPPSLFTQFFTLLAASPKPSTCNFTLPQFGNCNPAQRPCIRPRRVLKKNRLPAVGVADPFVKNQHPREILQVFHFAQFFIRQKIVQRHAPRIPRIARPELQPRRARRPRPRQLDAQLRRQADQLGPNLHHFHRRRRQPQPRCQPCTQQLVYQNPPVLRVILKLHHIIVFVRAPHQVRLGAASHPPDLLQSLDHVRLS